MRDRKALHGKSKFSPNWKKQQEKVTIIILQALMISLKILVMGITFKENCPDIRNTKVVDVVRTLQEYDAQVTVYDPWANAEEVKREYDIEITNQLPEEQFDAVAVAVLHQQFSHLDYSKLLKDNSVVYNFKG
ncbi:hypothetical protein FACS1894162_7610 [Bacteroidia bacterium]|nr:hypothetical protein FACS1894162_7610 [Bacteroidia bacterium]